MSYLDLLPTDVLRYIQSFLMISKEEVKNQKTGVNILIRHFADYPRIFYTMYYKPIFPISYRILDAIKLDLRLSYCYYPNPIRLAHRNQILSVTENPGYINPYKPFNQDILKHYRIKKRIRKILANKGHDRFSIHLWTINRLNNINIGGISKIIPKLKFLPPHDWYDDSDIYYLNYGLSSACLIYNQILSEKECELKWKRCECIFYDY